MRAIALFLLLACTTRAIAQTVTANPFALVTWQPVAANEDGSAINDLVGYVVYQGTSPLLMAPVGRTDSSRLAYLVAGLAPGTYYFAVTAVNSSGVESARSAPASIAVRAGAAPGAARSQSDLSPSAGCGCSAAGS